MIREFIITCVNEEDADQLEREYPNARLIRCKDCDHYDTSGCADGFGWCYRNGMGHGCSDYWFCADGEKEEENA